MRLLHTSDWHLGHTLKDVTREHEHAAFLAWLLETCAREEPDVLVITGDVFDSGTPPASAEKMWFELLAAARRIRPTMDIVAIAGNHDSPGRLAAPSAVLRELGVHVVGGLPRRLQPSSTTSAATSGAGRDASIASTHVGRDSSTASTDVGRDASATRTDAGRDSSTASTDVGRDSSATRTDAGRDSSTASTDVGRDSSIASTHVGRDSSIASTHVGGDASTAPELELDLERILIPVAGGRGLVAAVPFLRPVDVPPDVEDPLALVYGEVIAAARARRGADQALVVLGHLYVTGADPSHLSERRISIGGTESASLRLFPDDISYVALGHMHRAQRVGRETIRYAGAPIALSLDEARYRHQVVVVDFDGAVVREMRTIEIPQAIEIVRIPARGEATLDEALAQIAALPARLPAPLQLGVDPGGPAYADDPARPYLEVAIALERPEPRLRTMIETALEGKRARLVQLHANLSGDGAALGDRISVHQQRLAELDPRDVFARLWARSHAEEPSTAVRGAFERLLAEVSGDVDDPARKREAS